jgi:uncharacterized protein with ACT and thioredoxin-like domain
MILQAATESDLHEFVLSTKMVDKSPSVADEAVCDEITAGTNALALRGQAAVLEEAALYAAL